MSTKTAQLGAWVALAALGAMAAAVGMRPIEDGDLFWNLAIGRWLLTHHTLLPSVDPFTYNAISAPVQHEWLSQVALAALADVGGLTTLRLLSGAWCALVAAVAFLALRRRGAGDCAAILGACLWWVLATPHAVLRPHLLAWLPAWVTIGWLLGDVRPKRVLAGFAVVSLWGNLHGSVLLAPAWCAAMLPTAALIARRTGRPMAPAAKPWAIHLSWTSAAMLLQPAGWSLVPYALSTPAVNKALSNEWWPLLRGDVWAARPLVIVAWGTVALATMIALFGAARAPIWPPRAPGPLLAAGATLHAALTRRMTAFMMLPLLWLLDRLASRETTSRHRQWVSLAGAALCLVAIFPETHGWRRPAPLRPGAFPVVATAFVSKAKLSGRPLNPDGWGGYLSWHLGENTKTFADGRWPLVGQTVIANGVAMLARQRDPAPLMAKYQIDWLIQPRGLYLQVPPPNPARWVLAWQDAQTVVLLRRGPAFAKNVANVCRLYASQPSLRHAASWPMRARGPQGVAVPTDVPSILTLCKEPS